MSSDPLTLQALGSTMYFFDSQREGYLSVSNEASFQAAPLIMHCLGMSSTQAALALVVQHPPCPLPTATPRPALPPLCRCPGGATPLWLITTPPSPWPPPCPTTPAWGWAWDRWVGAQWSQHGREPAEAAV